MSDEIKCPVCGKVGIPNYHDEDIVCPCCGSDLSIFRVIDKLPTSTGPKHTVWKPIAIAAISVTMALGAFLIIKPSATGVKSESNDGLQSEIAYLRDSISRLNIQLQKAAKSDADANGGGFKYVVRKGDSFWSISKRFYGTGTRFEEVATANGLDRDSKLNIGDTITIKE